MDFAKQKQARLAEQAFLLAMRQSKFEDALRFAKTALELDPANTRYKDFVPLLEEKIALAAETDDEEDDDGPEGEGEGEGHADEESEDGEEETSDEDEDEADEENSADEASEAGPAGQELDSITLDAKDLKLKKEARNKLRQSLLQGILDLKEKELVAKIQASDPLLG